MHLSCPHCLWELCSEHCGNDFPLIFRELIPKCNLYLSSKSTWIINVMEIYLTSILSTVFKHLKWIDKDLAKFGGKSGHGFYFLNSNIYSKQIYFQIQKLHFWLFFKPYHYHHHCAKSHQSCLTLWDPMDVACQASLSMGLSRQEYWSGLFQGVFLTQGLSPGLLYYRQILHCLNHKGNQNFYNVVFLCSVAKL